MDVLKEISLNRQAHKLFISNLEPDLDDPVADTISRLENFFITSSKTFSLEEHDASHVDLITHLFCESKIDINAFSKQFPSITLIRDNWVASDGNHLGPAIVRQLNLLLDWALQSKPGFLSILIPVLNEKANLPACLEKIADEISDEFFPHEIVVVDGGSQDGTAEFLQGIVSRKIQVIQELGIERGMAIRRGIEFCRGDVIAIFHGDNEYDVMDLRRAISILREENFDFLIGSRTNRTQTIKEQIQKVYRDDKFMGFIAYWGSMMISISCLLSLKRFITDPLSGIKVFRRDLVIDYDFKENGLSFDVELIALAIRKRYSLVEIPVSYAPRSRKNGKKTTPRKAIGTLLFLWFRR
jgi:hypothetical protein